MGSTSLRGQVFYTAKKETLGAGAGIGYMMYVNINKVNTMVGTVCWQGGCKEREHVANGRNKARQT